MTRFELEFSDYSYGFRPKNNMQQALQQSLAYILQLIYEKVECKTTTFDT